MSAARNKRRRHGRRGRFGFLYKMLAFVALASALVVGATIFFRVETIRVEGNVRYEAQQVIDATQVLQGDNLFGLNKNEVARRIRQTLPYVEGVAIRRNLPDTLVIRVEECRAAAWFENREGRWLISTAGKVLENVSPGSEQGIRLDGLEVVSPEAGLKLSVHEGHEFRMTGALELLKALELKGMTEQVTCIDLTSPVRIVMDYRGRFAVRLPVNGDFNYLLELMAAAAATLETYEKGTLDLTTDDFGVIFSPA